MTRCPPALFALATGCGFSTAGEHPLFAKSSAIAEDLPCADYHVDDGTKEGHSTHLGCTGLYSNWSQRVVSPEGLTLDELVRQELLTENPDRAYLIPGDVDAREALAWLHSNCGTACHNERLLPGATQLHLILKTSALTAVEDTDAWTTGVGRPSRYRPSPLCRESPWLRISPGDPECSTVSYRAGVRDEYPGPYFNQMPPLLSHRVSVEAVEILRRWIVSIPPQAAVTPSSPTGQ